MSYKKFETLESFLERYLDEYDIEYLDCEYPDVILIKK